MHDDVFQMYLEEVNRIPACTPEEEERLLRCVKQGDRQARERLLEGSLGYLAGLAGKYAGQGLSEADLVQEANLAFFTAVDCYEEGDFRGCLAAEVEAALKAAVEIQKREAGVQEEMTARVNVLQEVSRRMAEELNREATLAELSAKMKMTEDEVRDIMQQTMNAVAVSRANGGSGAEPIEIDLDG